MFLVLILHLAVELMKLWCLNWYQVDAYSAWVYLNRCVSISFVQMISAEAPVLFAKAAQIFITELTLRAWIHTEDNKRRTLQVWHGVCHSFPTFLF